MKPPTNLLLVKRLRFSVRFSPSRAFSSTTTAATVSSTRYPTASSGRLASGSSKNNIIPVNHHPFLSQQKYSLRQYSSTTSLSMSEDTKKPGVADVDELEAAITSTDPTNLLVVIDVRNPDPEVEPGDQKSLAVAGLPTSTERPNAKHYIWDRAEGKLQLSEEDEKFLAALPKDMPIITHCGGGGRGQKAKVWLENEYQFTNVHNGGGPKEQELWKVYGDK